MSTQTVATQVQPIADTPAQDSKQAAVCFVQSKACRGWLYTADKLYVPPVEWMYKSLYGTAPDHQLPLTVEDMAPYIRCAAHSSGLLSEAYNKEHGISGMYPLSKTLALMEKWAEAPLLKEQKRAARQARRERIRALEAGVVRQLPLREKNYGTPKFVASVLPTPNKKKGKGKKGQEQQQGGKKGKGR